MCWLQGVFKYKVVIIKQALLPFFWLFKTAATLKIGPPFFDFFAAYFVFDHTLCFIVDEMMALDVYKATNDDPKQMQKGLSYGKKLGVNR